MCNIITFNIFLKLCNVVSSAYIIQLNFRHVLVKSFMYIILNKSPKIDPCGQNNFV